MKADLDAHAEANYAPDEINQLRSRKPLSPALQDKIIDGIFTFAHRFVEAGEPNPRKWATARELPLTFKFRFAVCAYMHALHWIVAGGKEDRKDEDFRNDFIDVALAAFGTCFDGLLTRDKLPQEIHDNAAFLLKTLFLNPKLQPPLRKKRAATPQDIPYSLFMRMALANSMGFAEHSDVQ